ncbi:hypothetical protein SDJN02_15725, partial [Cucurbita argyrosperma subsp. argyrosperma]
MTGYRNPPSHIFLEGNMNHCLLTFSIKRAIDFGATTHMTALTTMNYKMDNQLKYKIPFPEAVNTMTKGQICGGKPCVAISSPTDITAALAAARDGYVYDKPSERKGVEIPRLKYPAQNHFWANFLRKQKPGQMT